MGTLSKLGLQLRNKLAGAVRDGVHAGESVLVGNRLEIRAPLVGGKVY